MRPLSSVNSYYKTTTVPEVSRDVFLGYSLTFDSQGLNLVRDTLPSYEVTDLCDPCVTSASLVWDLMSVAPGGSSPPLGTTPVSDHREETDTGGSHQGRVYVPLQRCRTRDEPVWMDPTWVTGCPLDWSPPESRCPGTRVPPGVERTVRTYTGSPPG